MRQVSEVIDAIIPIFKENNIGVEVLENIKDTCYCFFFFRAPEVERWIDLERHLLDLVACEILPFPNKDSPLWVRQVQAIVRNEEVPTK